MPVGTGMIATQPMEENQALDPVSSGVANLDTNFVLNYYRLSAYNRVRFGSRVSYSSLDRKNLSSHFAIKCSQCFPNPET